MTDPVVVGDSFDFYSGRSTGAMPLDLLYTENVEASIGITPSLVTGRFSGSQALRLTGFAGGAGSGLVFLNRGLPSLWSAIGFSFAFRRSSYNIATTGGGSTIWRARNAAGVQFRIGVNSAGLLVAGRGNYTTELMGTASHRPMAQDDWFTIDVRAPIGNSVDFALLLDGAEVLALAGVDTQAQATGGVSSFDLCSETFAFGQFQNNDFDDAYWRDDGMTFSQPYRASPLRPSADGGTNQWTPSAGTDHFAMIDDTTADGDTTNLQDATVGHIDEVELADLDVSPDEIGFVQAVTVGRKTDAGLVQVRTNFKSGATVENGHDQTLGVNYGVELDVAMVDPDTTDPWSTSGINALRLQLETLAA